MDYLYMYLYRVPGYLIGTVGNFTPFPLSSHLTLYDPKYHSSISQYVMSVSSRISENDWWQTG